MSIPVLATVEQLNTSRLFVSPSLLQGPLSLVRTDESTTIG